LQHEKPRFGGVFPFAHTHRSSTFQDIAMQRTTIAARTALVALALAGALATQAQAPKPVQRKGLPTASPEQLAAADRALKGKYDCDAKQTLTVASHSSEKGYLDVTFGKSKYTMRPMVTSTGGMRMEDVTGRMLLLQIAKKSTLMDTKVAQRVADNCVHPAQR
jgi:hypothetical protein